MTNRVFEGRLSAADVRQALRGDVDDETLRRLLRELRDDPAWIVLEFRTQPPDCVFQMVYAPTGTPYTFRARRLAAGLWRFPG
jgi:hypothetical protein